MLVFRFSGKGKNGIMKSWIDAFCIAFAMYSVLPVKCLRWKKENLRYAMIFFPLVGILCGFGLLMVWTICYFLRIRAILFGALSVLMLVFVTGGIHLDGFCDTADALFSRRSMEEKLRILKDPNCGPFAVFSVILLLMVQFGSFVEIYGSYSPFILGLITCAMMMIRCLSGISIMTFPIASSSSLAKTFSENSEKPVQWILIVLYAVLGVLALVVWKWLALIVVSISLLIFAGYYRMQKKAFGGVTGDLAGFFLEICETGVLLGIAMAGGVLFCG